MKKILGSILAAVGMLSFVALIGVIVFVPNPKHPMTAVCFSITGAHSPVVYYHEDTIVLDQTGFWSKDGKIRYYPPFGEGCKLMDGKYVPPQQPKDPEEEAPEENGNKLHLPYKHPLQDHLQPDPDMGDREVFNNNNKIFKSI